MATGHNEYWPIYLSIGNIHNNLRRAHRNGLVLLGFLTIPKCKYILHRNFFKFRFSHLASREFLDNASFRKFHRQLLHSSLAKILESLKPGMTTPEVVRFPDGHF